MTPNNGDHLLVLLIAVVAPAYWAIGWIRGRSHLDTDPPDARVRAHLETIVEQWILTTAVLSWWFWSGRTTADIGLGVPGGWAFWVGMLVVVAGVIVLGRQAMQVWTSERVRASARRKLGDAGGAFLFAPRNARERWSWFALSLTAGTCEEVLYRAFLMLYLMNWIPELATLPIAAVVFGFAHVYLGLVGAVRAAALGLVFGGLYLFTGTLWVPMILHVTVDITSGLMLEAMLREAPGARVAAAEELSS